MPAERAAPGNLAPQESPDFEAVTTIWLGAIENYWVVTNLHGHRPSGWTTTASYGNGFAR
ncbi:hypothetical protein [Actinomadura sp. WMMB 499]|uniref:hypothetical protein n=1 Tax=Actinomadura sp. WMMB 499 TaxID=1219491 RepID=UPI001244F1BC|nr:hypothetical protein [Actinomadura sp. WMMB 499]QFG23094.1 hypothetical protein F7P10_20175 [Actinomadura sp. WMMB 499]